MTISALTAGDPKPDAGPEASAEPPPSLPPGPRGRRLRNIWRQGTGCLEFMEDLNRQYGDIVSYRIPGMQCCALFSTDLAREIQVNQQLNFPPWFPGGLDQLLERGALPLFNGEEQRVRSEFMKGAFTDERLRKYSEWILGRARELRDRCRPGSTVPLIQQMKLFTWDSLVDIIAGPGADLPHQVGEDILNFEKLVLIQNLLPAPWLFKKLPLPAYRRGYASIGRFDEVMYGAIERARKPDHPGDDIISHYVRAKDYEWVPPDDRTIRDEMFGLLTAFVDAPTASLVYGVELPVRHPAVLERMEREIDTVIGDRPVEPEDFDRLPYMQAVLSESLRVEHPAHVLLPKRTVEDCVVGGYRIPAGTLVIVAMRALHRRAEHWDEPEAFRPERWLGENPVGTSRCPHHAYIPFGNGPHYCRGAGVATRLFVLGLATLMQTLRFEPVSDRRPRRSNTAVGLEGRWGVKVHERRRAGGGA